MSASRYAEGAARPLPDLRYYVVFAFWKMAMLLEGHWVRHAHGTAGDFDLAYLETAGRPSRPACDGRPRTG
jgi:hypothetical protein